ncbi:LuxR C-terminal-related transcriptional regulator [Solimonas aquatica]|nr:LuxR C-terminal-related transcriptional regulator [Solimonas aquatica]
MARAALAMRTIHPKPDMNAQLKRPPTGAGGKSRPDSATAEERRLGRVTANTLPRDKLPPPSASDRIVAIIAPSGYGKTTLALQWFQQVERDTTAGWLQIDADCRDSAVFIAKLEEAMNICRRRDGNAFCGVDDMEAAIDTWGAELRARRSPQLLFVDDAHLLEGSSAMRCLHLLIQGSPRNLGLVITSRNAEGLGLAAGTLRGEIRWITASQLALSQAEIAALALRNGQDLDPDEIDTISDLTEGWPVLTQLALCGMTARSRKEIASNNQMGIPVSAYIHDQFLAALTDTERKVATVMAILAEATLDLVESLTQASAKEALARFERIGTIRRHFRRERSALFVMHPMIREEVISRDPCDMAYRKSVQEHAAVWWWSHGEQERAIRLAISAGLEKNSRDWLLHYAPILIHREGRHETFLELLGAAEALWGRRERRLSSWSVSALMFLRRYPEAERLLVELSEAGGSQDEDGETGGAQQYDPADLQRAVIAGLCDDYIAAGKFAKNWIDLGGGELFYQGMAWIAVAFSQKCQCEFSAVRASLNNARLLARTAGSAYAIAWARVVGVAALLKEGRFREVLAETAAAEAEFGDARAGVADLLALMKATSALASYERGDFENCLAALEVAMPCLHRQGIVDAMIAGYVAAARLQAARGQMSAALDVLAEGQRVGRDRGLARLCITLDFEREMLLLKHGASQTHSLEALASVNSGGRPMPGLLRDKNTRLSIRLAIANGCAGAEGEALKAAVVRARQTGQRYKLAELLVFDALRLHAMGRTTQALGALTESLEIAVSEGYFRLYVDEGESILGLLRLLGKGNALAEPVAALVAGILQAKATEDNSSGNPAVDVLSDREMEILVLVDEGLSNKDISRKLFLTEGTVKWHLHNLYSKLHVKSRTSALHAAKSAGLLA